MIKLQKRQSGFKGGITPFLSLVFVLLLSLAGAMIQSASIQTSKSVRRAEMNLAIENIFAEYNTELLKRYDLFARECHSEQEIAARLQFYGVVETQHEVMESALLSDLSGEAFFQQAVYSMGGELETESFSVDLFQDEKKEQVENQLNSILSSKGAELPAEQNPIKFIENLKNSNLLSLVYPNQEQLSNRNVSLGELPSHRVLEKGVGNMVKKTEKNAKNQVLFVLYLAEHFPDMLENTYQSPLLYEMEYLLGGKESDKENLKVAAEKILAIRMAVNYAYLMTDETRKAEAQNVAVGICSLLAIPEASEVLKQAMLLAWAYGESVVDLRVLFKGEKVPLVKTTDTWQLGLSNLFRLTSGEAAGEKQSTEGVDYAHYLKALLMAEEKETLCMRALDLIELNTGVHVDECLTGVSVESVCMLRRNVTYTFRTKYQYE